MFIVNGWGVEYVSSVPPSDLWGRDDEKELEDTVSNPVRITEQPLRQ